LVVAMASETSREAVRHSCRSILLQPCIGASAIKQILNHPSEQTSVGY
jgi:hypothetical protein